MLVDVEFAVSSIQSNFFFISSTNSLIDFSVVAVLSVILLIFVAISHLTRAPLVCKNTFYIKTGQIILQNQTWGL